MEVKFGDIVYANLSPVVGSEQSGIRPVLVLQNNIGNKYSPTVIVAPLTTKIKKNIPTHVLIEKRYSNLRFDSTCLLEQIRTIDKQRIIKYVSCIPQSIMEEVKKSLKINFNIRGDVLEFLSYYYLN